MNKSELLEKVNALHSAKVEELRISSASNVMINIEVLQEKIAEQQEILDRISKAVTVSEIEELYALIHPIRFTGHNGNRF